MDDEAKKEKKTVTITLPGYGTEEAEVDARSVWYEAYSLQEWPRGLEQLRCLVQVVAKGNALTRLPEAVGELTNLQSLELNCNRLVTLPDSIGNLTGLNTLMLDHNKLERLPRSLGRLTSLQFLNLDYNELEVLPTSFRDLTSLAFFSCNYNYLPEVDLSSMYSCNVSQVLDAQWARTRTELGDLAIALAHLRLPVLVLLEIAEALDESVVDVAASAWNVLAVICTKYMRMQESN